jgi:hypothetical protein
MGRYNEIYMVQTEYDSREDMHPKEIQLLGHTFWKAGATFKKNR